MIWRYINLEKHKDRNENMKNFFNKNNISFKRINAYSPDNIKLKVDTKICCLFSHLNAIEDFYHSNEEITIICEDDLDDKLFKYHNINDIINNAPKDWEILQLSYSITKFEQTFIKHKYIPWKYRYFGTLCYAINKKAAKKLLYDNIKFDNNLRLNVADYIIYKNVKTYTYNLSLFITNINFESAINNTIKSLKKYNDNSINIYKMLNIF